MDFKKLSEPFRYEELDWRMLRAGVNNDRPWGFCAAYVDARAIMNRLDGVCGPANWKTEFTQMGQGVLCRLSIRVNEEWIAKTDGSDETSEDPFKGGISKALVRAAVSWGIGRYLYDLPQLFADFGEVNKDTKGAKYSKIDGKSFYWLPPHKLPAWALPEEEKKNAEPEQPKQPEHDRFAPMVIPPSGQPVSNLGDVVVPFGHNQGRPLKALSKDDLGGLADFYSRVPDPKGKAKTFKTLFDQFMATARAAK